VIEAALRVLLHPLQDKAVPTTLLTVEQVAQRVRDTRPAFVSTAGGSDADSVGSIGSASGVSSASVGTTSATSKPAMPNSIGVVQAQLSNGMKVNMKPLSTESQRVSVRLYIPGELICRRHGVSF